MANDCEKITFYAPSDRRGGVKPIPSCEPGQLIVPEDLPIPPNPETPEPPVRMPRPLEVRSAPYTFICDNERDREAYGYDPETNDRVKIPAKYLSTEDVGDPDYIENYYYGSGSAVIVPEGYVTTVIPFSSIPDIASDVLNYIAVNNREIDIEYLLQLASPGLDADERVNNLVNKLVRSYGFTAAQAETLVNLFDTAQRKADESARTYGESTLVCAWENAVQETSCTDPTMAHYYDHPDAVHHAVIPAGTYKSLISQADADQMAADAAAAMLNCFYVSDAVQVSCTDLGYEEPVPNTDGRMGTVVVPRGTFTSTISIKDATEQATTYAKSLLVCYYTNTKISLSCEDENARNLGVTPTEDNRVEITLTSASSRIPGKGQVITIEPGVIRSNISTAAAIQEATLLAESLLECCFVNVAKDVTCPNYEYTYTDENGVKQTDQIPASKEKSPQYSMHIDAGVFSSCVSQEEADREAETFIQSTLSCYYCNTVVWPTCVPDDVLQEVKEAIARGAYSALPLDPNNYNISQWSEDATVGAPPEYVCGFDYEQAQQIAETAARTIIHDLRSTEAGKCRYTNDLLYAGCYFNDPFGNDMNGGTKAVYYKAYAPGIGKIPYFVYKANVDTRLNKNVSTPKLGTYVAIPAGTISVTINDVPASFKAPDVIKTTTFNQLAPDDDDNVTTEELPMPDVEFNEDGEIESEAMRVKAYANELALKMAMGMVQCLYANPEMSITCYDVGKPGASSPDGTNAWTVPAELFVGPSYKVVIREAKKLLESMTLCLYPNAPRTCSAGCNPCATPLTNGFLSLEENDITTLGMQSMTVHIPAKMFWAATSAEANAQAMAMCALPAPTCERMISVNVTATCNAVCKAAGIDISLTEDDKEWGLMFWQENCEGYIDGIFKDPCFEVIGAGSSSSDGEEVKVTVTSGTSGSSCEDLLVSATALCVVECQAKAEYAFTNRQLFLECPDFASKYEIKQGTYRGSKETVREILRNLRRYYCNDIKLKQVGRKGVKVSDIEEDPETEGDNKTDVTHETDINEETYAQIDGKQIIELNAKFEANAMASVDQLDNNSNVFIYDNVETIEEEDNALRKVQIAAIDSTYYAGTGISIKKMPAVDPCHPMYEISTTGEGGEITLEPVNPDPISLDDGKTLLDPLVISTDGGNYLTGREPGDAPAGTSFKLNVAAQVPKTPDCITVLKDDESTRTDVPRCEYFKYELSLGEDSGLKTVAKDDATSSGNGIAAKDLVVDAGAGLSLGLKDGKPGTLHVLTSPPLWVNNENEVDFKYDEQWFNVENGRLTFIGDVGDDTQISVTATTPESTGTYENGTHVLAPLKISTTEAGTYYDNAEQTGIKFYISATRQEFDTPDCIAIDRSVYKDNGPDRYERYNFSVLTGNGLEKVANGEPLSSFGYTQKVLQVKAEPNSPIKVTTAGVGLKYEDPIKVTSNGVGLKYEDPIKVTSNGVGLKYDEQWFNKTSDGRLTFIGDVGGEEIILEPVNPPASDMALDDGASLQAPLVISTDGGAYRTGAETDEAPSGTSFELNVVAQIPRTFDCISVHKNMAADKTDPPRCEYLYYELSLGEDKGLKAVEREDVASRGKGLATKDLEVDAGLGLELGPKDGGGTLHVKPANPIKVDANGVGLKYEDPIKVTSNGVGLKYDGQWFDKTSDGALTFKGDISVEEASFGPGVTTVVGTIGGAQWGEVGGAFSCANGQLTVPLPAAAEYSGGTVTPGLIRGVEFSKTDTTSKIEAGLIKLAAANAASYCDGTTEGTPGGIHGIGYSSGNTFSIDKGFIRIPRPSSYTFDSEWFDVTDGQVTLKSTALEDVINELVDELAVNIDVTTDLERVNVIQGEKIIRATSDATLTLDTNVQAVNV